MRVGLKCASCEKANYIPLDDSVKSKAFNEEQRNSLFQRYKVPYVLEGCFEHHQEFDIMFKVVNNQNCVLMRTFAILHLMPLSLCRYPSVGWLLCICLF